MTQPSPVLVPGLTSSAVSIAAASNHTLVADVNGAVWAFGFNGGATGDGQTYYTASPVHSSPLAAMIASVGASYGSSYGLTLDGTLWGWGANDHGQLGDGSTMLRLSPEQVTGIGPLVRVAGGATHTVGLQADGTLLAWGGNDVGQAGTGP